MDTSYGAVGNIAIPTIEQSEEVKKKVKAKLDRLSRMKTDRMIWETNWQECHQYTTPRQGKVIGTTIPGQKLGWDLFDTTAIMSNELLSGALHGMLTNPAVTFFDMVMLDPRDMEDEEVRKWCHECGMLMYQALNQTNFQTEIHEIYIDLGNIGTACLYMGDHEEKLVHYSARPIKEVYCMENNLGIVDIVYRVFNWNARQIIQEFGEENVPAFVLELFRNGRDDDMEILHATEPQSVESKKSVFEYESTYILTEKQYLLNEGGFREMPFAVPRWTKNSGETYGRGCGMQMLPDIKMVNAMMETVIKGAQLTVMPPMMVADDGIVGRVRMIPGGLTVVRSGVERPIQPLVVNAQIDFGLKTVEDVRKRIKTGFYGDLFSLNEGPQRTATETNMIAEQQMKLMGPILGRQHAELLRPVMTRLFNIMWRKKKLPAPPAKIQNKPWDVRYSSLVARAQRMAEGQNLVRAISVAAPIIQLSPPAADILSADETFRYILEVYGVPERCMASQNDIKNIRAGRAKAQQQQAKQMQEQHQAQVLGQTGPAVAQMAQAAKAQPGGQE